MFSNVGQANVKGVSVTKCMDLRMERVGNGMTNVVEARERTDSGWGT